MRRAEPSSPRPGARRAAAGFTLVEMLVTLVVVSVVTTLLWQALALTARLEQSLARSRDLGQDAALRAAWLQQALEGLVVPPGAEVGLEGDGRGLRAQTTAPPWPGSPGPEAFALELREDGEGDAAARRLWARRPATGETFDLGPRPAGARFEYLDADGRWLGAWPPEALATRPGGAQRPLPRAVRLAVPAGDGAAPAAAGADAQALAPQVAAPQATRNPMLARRQAQPADDVR